MSEDICYTCDQPLPAGQSFYENYGVKVCLTCFKDSPRCKRCKFPSRKLENFPGFGTVCEFCRKELSGDSGMVCYLCDKPILVGGSHYSDHGVQVCQECFQYAPRCFLCRFPHSIKEVEGLGHICEFCRPGAIQRGTEASSIIAALKGFLSHFDHDTPAEVPIVRIDWNILAGMQMEKPENIEVKFLDEFIRRYYPVYFLKGKFYAMAAMPREFFMPYLAAQLAAADLCREYELTKLLGDGPFYSLARGWCHYVGLTAARTLKFSNAVKMFQRHPDSDLRGDFPKFLAMSEFRKPKEITEFAHSNLRKFAKKYL